MDFKCFMKLLEEKKYIEEIGICKDISVNYKCKYEEVTNKIIEEIQDWHKTDDDYMHNIRYQKTGKGIKIIFVNETKKLLSNILNRQEKRIVHENDIDDINLTQLLENDEDYSVSWNSMWDYYTVTDLNAKRKREDKENKEKEECLEFLKQLP